jgi:uncharacterized protein YecT (DUF1311 family)
LGINAVTVGDMLRVVFLALFIVLAWQAVAADVPCRHIEKDPAFTACWRDEFKKSDAEVTRRLRVLTERHRKDEPSLYRLIVKAQETWLIWREATCRVETYESKGGAGFSVYWDQCRIKMNEARAAELQNMIDSP